MLRRLFIELSAMVCFAVPMSVGEAVLVEAESFDDKGGWVVDQQFTDTMGSPYLLAHGLGRLVDDAVVEETRAIDVPYQQNLNGSPQDFLSKALFRKVPRYYILFRCLYSKNVDNLMMAGRCFSYSHVGLGGPRVMLTCRQMGIATGYAASLCKKYCTNPRGVYKSHITELKGLVSNKPANDN